MPNGWRNLEVASNVIPDNQYFEGESAFKFMGLTRMQRLYGFGGCLAVGFILSVLGTVLLFLQQYNSFAIIYSLGIVISLVGTGFVIGFFRQLKLMFKPVRIIATVVFFASIGLVFVGAYVLHSGLVCIIFVVIEYLAYTWYTLSYIPYARTAVLKLIGMA